MTRRWRYCAVVPVVAALALGCSAETTTPGQPAPASATETAEADAVVIAVRIAEGTVTPVHARLDATVGQPIELIVDSDATDELHVHATPEHTFAVEPAAGQRFRFTVEVPGRVEIELHHSHRTVATVDVRP
ncbi:hypothetical protein [Nocardia cyriacigeorgica]|uniref:hypothetical protein n=1 Tax=Nocardia cyriacigeorgica TaxID=135487 RepID=UPI0024544094|nr:hypothetical protein [Nocardia cyriacigeorgica]